MKADIDPALLLEHAERELAQRSLLDFGRRVYRGFQAPPHIAYIAALLEKVAAGELKRVVCNTPPRFGKSLLCSSIFPAWYLGNHPRKNVILASHSAELSIKNSRTARMILEDDSWPFAARLSPDSSAVYRWDLTDGGGCYAVGVGGSVTGRGGDVIIVDDPLHDEGSEGERANAAQWFSEVLVPRLEPHGAIVLLGTRFAEDDVFGHVLSSTGAAQWTHVRLPAFAEEDDILGRKVGVSLWPARMPDSELRDRRESMGPRAFESQYQQNPLPAAGNVIKREWLEHRFHSVPEGLKITVALDASAKTGVSNDYSVAVVIGSNKTKHYVLDVWRQRLDFPGLKRMLLAVSEKWNPATIYIEDASTGIQLVQTLKAETSLPIVPITAKGSKISRIEAITGQLEAGNVLLPADHNAPAWLAEFRRELLAVPNSKHDDQSDALALGLSKAATNRGFFYIGPVDGFSVDGSSTDLDAPAERCFEYLPDNVAIPNEVQS